MCGIVGAAGQRNVTPILLEGLRRLEYRGYDSAGIAVLNDKEELDRVRAVGKIRNLEEALESNPLKGSIGIGHTRWATHGAPSDYNAHPHICRDRVAIVHNGIIENHGELRRSQKENGHEFCSETDTEVIVHQVYDYLEAGNSLLNSVRKTLDMLDGAYALGVISTCEPGHLIAARKGSPLVIGIGIEENFIASDVLALLPVTQRFICLEEGDIAEITGGHVTIYDSSGQTAERPIHESELSSGSVDRGKYRHYMLKEIYEQPQAVSDTLEGRIVEGRVPDETFGLKAVDVLDNIRRVQIVACGTSYNAGLVASHWFEGLAGIPCNVEVASEFRYRRHVVQPDTLFVTISQSGETADTLAALHEAKSLGYAHSLAICNSPESSLVRESELVLITRAGPEIGVASTKAFTTQLTSLMLLVIVLGRRFVLNAELEKKLVGQLLSLPRQIEDVLGLDAEIKAMAERIADKHHALFLGRGTEYPVAIEGALKLKEISYIHAEAYPAGELKHGPLALVDEDMPVIAVAPNNELLEKLESNLQEVKARGGQLFVFADAEVNIMGESGEHILKVIPSENEISPIVYSVPLQLLAYHVAVLRGTDVDQPRNLAKSVTVE